MATDRKRPDHPQRGRKWSQRVTETSDCNLADAVRTLASTTAE